MAGPAPSDDGFQHRGHVFDALRVGGPLAQRGILEFGVWEPGGRLSSVVVVAMQGLSCRTPSVARGVTAVTLDVSKAKNDELGLVFGTAKVIV